MKNPTTNLSFLSPIAFAMAVAALALTTACSDSDSAAPGSACGGCAADEVCAQYYDGTCKAMYALCMKVSPTCQQLVSTDPEACTKDANRSCRVEICGSRADGGVTFACGGPRCSHEVPGSDIGCYGP